MADDPSPAEPRSSLDEAYLSALRCQDAAAFSRLVDEHQQIVLGLGQSMGLRNADLEDAAAEAFAAIYRALPGFEARSKLSTWVYQIACRTFWRSRKQRDAHPSATLNEDRADDQQPSPMQQASAAEEHELLWAAVATLEPRQSMAVELHYRRGISVEEIARIMECPQGTIKTLLFRAREKLREKLQQKLHEGGERHDER